MANLGLIDFKLVCISKLMQMMGKKNLAKQFGQNGHQLAQNRPDATLAHEH